MRSSGLEKLNAIAQAIYDKKGFNILAIDVREISSLTDYFLIAEGSVGRHVQSLGLAVREKAAEMGSSIFHIEGGKTGDWMVVDCGDILIHLFSPELREKYRLEELWHGGTLVDLALKLENSEGGERYSER
jgi:ribosome-associated protein